uniref:STAS domain-containing protein n=1 Tax=Acrobeloides nanus TaxID=290746 RepID=A0A914DNR1_9BILA
MKNGSDFRKTNSDDDNPRRLLLSNAIPSNEFSNPLSFSRISQDAEDGPELLQGIYPYNASRAPMNQDEFDIRFNYNKPIYKGNAYARHFKNFFRRYYSPVLSCDAFINTIFGFIPILNWLPNYSFKENLLSDIVGGLTVGIMHVPQGIAYAILAKVDPVVGLYTSFFAPLFYMIFGTSRHNSIGSFAVVSLMCGLTVERVMSAHSIEQNLLSLSLTDSTLQASDGVVESSWTPIAIASTLSFCVGLIQLLMGLLRLEIVTTYFSDQVIGGFTTGASLHVAVAQLPALFGIVRLPSRSGPANLFFKLYDIARNITHLHVTTVIISFFSLLFLWIGKDYMNPFIKKRANLPTQIPFELILVILTTLLSFIFHFKSRFGVKIVDNLPTGIPMPQVPSWELIPEVLPSAIGIAVVVLAVHISLAKMFAKKMNYKVDAGQELYALGLTSSLSSFFPVYPVSCSLGRTMCVLSAIILFALKGMFRKVVDLKTLWPLSKIDFSIWLVSFVSTIGWDVTEGLCFSLAYALLTTVFRTQWPRWHYLSNLSGTNDYRDSERYMDAVSYPGLCIFRFDSPLLFTNVERFKSNIHKSYDKWLTYNLQLSITQSSNLTPEKDIESLCDAFTVMKNNEKTITEKSGCGILYQHFVIDCSGFTFVDYMGVNALKEIFNEMNSRRVIVYFAAAKAPVRDLFEASGFYKYVPKHNFYPTIRDAVAIARKRRDASASGVLGEPNFQHDSLETALQSQPLN